MNKFQLVKSLILLCFGIIGNCSIWGQTAYNLSVVNSVDESGLYVIEMDGHVLNNTISSNTLYCTTSYKTANLTGSESYVWQLEKDGNSFAMKNVSIGKYLNNTSTTSLSFDTTISSRWTFLCSDGQTTIQTNSSGQLRSIGDVGNLTQNRVYYEFKAYTNNDLPKSKHEFTIYQLISSIPAPISSAEYATFSSEYALDFSEETGLTVYTAAVNEVKTKVMLREVTSKKVPANTAVVLHGSTGSYTGRIIENADEITDNQLRVATSEMSGAENNIYVLNKKNGVVGFYKLSATGTLAKGKAYLTQDSAAPMLSMSDDWDTTAVTEIPGPTVAQNSACYTLDGRRVEHPIKGVFIQNGRKIIIR